jgi:WD40 repeat protein
MLRQLIDTGPVRQAAYSPDGKRLLIRGFAATTIWDIASGHEIVSVKESAYVSQAVLSPDGKLLLTNEVLNSQMVLNLTDAVTGQRLKRDIVRGVNHVAFSPSGQQFVTGQHDGTSRVCDTVTCKPRTPPIPHDGPVRYVAFSPDGRQVATASEDRTARVWDALRGQPLTPPLRHDGAVIQVAFHSSGRLLVTVCEVQQEGREEGSVRLWDVASGEPVTPPLRHESRILHAEFQPNGERLVTAAVDGTVRLWPLTAIEERPLEDIVLLAQLLGAQRLEARCGAVPLSCEALESAWHRLQSRYPVDFHPELGCKR